MNKHEIMQKLRELGLPEDVECDKYKDGDDVEPQQGEGHAAVEVDHGVDVAPQWWPKDTPVKGPEGEALIGEV